ncbi:MAG: hypothetical protein ABR612_13195, partial [Chromatocurvus sp.]
MNSSRRGITLSIVALFFMETSSIALASEASDQNNLRTALAKEQLYGAVGATNFGYKWGRQSRLATNVSDVSDNIEHASEKAMYWDANYRKSNSAQNEYFSTNSIGFRDGAEQTGYKWGIRSNAEQTGYKWGIRSDADQAGYKWGIRSNADQAGYKWGIRSDADQAGYK